MFLQNSHISISPLSKYQETAAIYFISFNPYVALAKRISTPPVIFGFLCWKVLSGHLLLFCPYSTVRQPNTSILIISARNTATLAYPVANRNIDVVRNRTSHDAFVHILSAHFGIVLVVSCSTLSATHQQRHRFK